MSLGSDANRLRSGHSPAGQPNVIVVVLDDLGFADLSCFGSSIQTPRIDALARGGLRYRNFHVAAMCSPTRACLLTGRNHHAVGMGLFPHVSLNLPGYSGRLPKSAASLARVLRDAGYSTFAAGKWHLTPRIESGASGPFDRWPSGMGFERFFGFLGGVTSQWTPDLVLDHGFIPSPASSAHDYHLTEDLASHAIRFLQDQHQDAPDKPFFLYLATGAVHAPHQAPREWIQAYEGQFDQGWDEERLQTFRRQKSHGILPPGTTLTERPPWVEPWDSFGLEQRGQLAQQMETYAGFVSHTDAQIGRVLDFVEQLDELDNTVVVVLSDNGASAEGGPHGVSPVGDNALRPMDQHYAWGWAWAGNTPFRLWKRYSWLGGVRVPLVVCWPRGISEQSRGEVRTQFCHAIDIMPTVLDAVGVQLPPVVDGVTQQRIDGASFLASLNDESFQSARETQYFETLGSRAIYHRGWKATTNHVDSNADELRLMLGSTDFDADTWSLHHLDADFSESRDLASTHPDQLRSLIDLWWYEAGRNDVLPLMNSEMTLAAGPTATDASDRAGHSEGTWLPGGGPIFTPSYLHGFRLTIDVKKVDRNSSGVLIAHHNFLTWGNTGDGGWACFATEGNLALTCCAAGAVSTVVTRARLADTSLVEVTFDPALGAVDEAFTVKLNGKAISGLGSISRTLARAHGVEGKAPDLMGKLIIGRDEGTPISDAYEVPSPFRGILGAITWKAPAAPVGEPVARLEAARRHQ